VDNEGLEVSLAAISLGMTKEESDNRYHVHFFTGCFALLAAFIILGMFMFLDLNKDWVLVCVIVPMTIAVESGIKMVFNEISFWWKNKVCVK